MSDRVFLGRYRSLRLLGQGGMSRIFLALELQRQREVVVKVLHDHLIHEDKARKHFQREIHVLSQLRHANAPEFYDASVDDPRGPILVMEYLRGLTLEEVLARQAPISVQRACHLIVQLCDLLSAIHGQGIVHRDLKPANLMLIHPGTPQETIKVMDFGLAKLAATLYIAPEDVIGSRRPIVSGTPQYVCPEQARGQDTDHRGDLYTVGVLMFEMLTGHRPFGRKGVKEMLDAHDKDTPRTFAEVGAAKSIPAGIEELVQSCLAKSPGARPQSAEELARRFQEALGLKPAAPVKAPVANSFKPTKTPVHLGRPTADGREDPYAIVYQMEVTMPESIVLLKLRGFIHDLRGEIVESVPGMIRVYLVENKNGGSEPSNGLLSWFSSAPAAKAAPTRMTEMRLHMEKKEGGRPNDLALKLVLREKGGRDANQGKWRARCDKLHTDLQAYLISGR
jgi:serine/threonine-protein kinase